MNLFKDSKFVTHFVDLYEFRKIGYFLKNEIASISSLNGSTKIDVNLDVEKEKKVRIKNTKGKNTKYTVSLKVKVLIKPYFFLKSFKAQFSEFKKEC